MNTPFDKDWTSVEDGIEPAIQMQSVMPEGIIQHHPVGSAWEGAGAGVVEELDVFDADPSVYIFQIDESYQTDQDGINKLAALLKSNLPERSHVIVLPPGITVQHTVRSPYYITEKVSDVERTVGFATHAEMMDYFNKEEKEAQAFISSLPFDAR